jgi:hypothetical protein
MATDESNKATAIPEGVPHADQPIALEYYLGAALALALKQGETEIATALVRIVEFRLKDGAGMSPDDVRVTREVIADAHARLKEATTATRRRVPE